MEIPRRILTSGSPIGLPHLQPFGFSLTSQSASNGAAGSSQTVGKKIVHSLFAVSRQSLVSPLLPKPSSSSLPASKTNSTAHIRHRRPVSSVVVAPSFTMRLLVLFQLVTALSSMGMVSATPIICSDVSLHLINLSRIGLAPSGYLLLTGRHVPVQFKRDLILKGELSPEACCSYGKCFKGVVVQSG